MTKLDKVARRKARTDKQLNRLFWSAENDQSGNTNKANPKRNPFNRNKLGNFR